jgi:GNAT superfamily N-acetyltransferase
MFCSPQLAAAIDRAEGRLCAAIAAQGRHGPAGAHARVAAVGGGTAIFAAAGSPINKLIGAGFDGAEDPADLDAVEAYFASHGSRLQAEVSTLADPDFHRRLCARGYAPSGFENVLGHPLAPLGAAPPGIDITLASADEFPVLADTLAEAFATPDVGGVGGDATPPSDEIRQWVITTLRVDGYRAYVARIGGAIAGGATVRIDGTIAQFAGAATLPAFRRRGVQTALYRARLDDAARAGCTVGVVVTQPASKSQQNAQREGFSLLYARQLLVKAPPLHS